MGLIQLIWPACLGLGKKGGKNTGAQARLSVPSIYNIINYFLYFNSKQSLKLECCRNVLSLLRRIVVAILLLTFNTKVNSIELFSASK